MRLQRKNLDRNFFQRGMTLIELMIALGIFGILVYAGTSLVNNIRVEEKLSEEDSELIGLRNEVISTVSCEETLFPNGGDDVIAECDFYVDPGATSCPAPKNNWIEVRKVSPRDKDGVKMAIAPVIGRVDTVEFKGNTGYKSLDVRARCTCCPECVSGKKILIEWRSRRNTQDFGDKKTYKWNDLFEGIPGWCVLPE